MSTDVITWAWKVRGLRGSAKLVLIRLADFAGQRGESWPTIERIEEDTGLGEDAVRAAIKALISAGLVYRSERWRSTPGGGRRSSEYVLLFDDKARAYAIDSGWQEGNTQVDDKQNDDNHETDGNAPPIACEGNPVNPGVAPGCDPANPGVAYGGATPEIPGGYPGNPGVAYKEEPSLKPSYSPPPPKGGVGDASLFHAFQKIWPFDSTDLVHPAQRKFSRLTVAEQELAVKWARSYLELASRQGRKRMTAENWLHRKGWQAFKAAPDTAATPSVWVAAHSAQWRAWEAYLAAQGSPSIKRDAEGRARLIALQTRRGFGRFMPSEWPPRPASDASRPGQRDGPAA
jgi:hypothetical protein